VNRDDVATRVAARYPTRFLRHYARGKISGDPLYEAVFERLRGSTEPILDLGCGAGFLALYLRERGVTAPIHGIDHDAGKIAMAKQAAGEWMTFAEGDVRDQGDWPGTVLMLDLLHYFDLETQSRLLNRTAASATTLILRDAVNDGSWRYRVTYAQETFSRAIGWLQAERLHFATREAIVSPFAGFETEVVPMFGRTPFNNYLFVFRRSQRVPDEQSSRAALLTTQS
jgi:SAM-dependent methyltransferase